MMNTVDRIIIEWFNSDFGTNFSGGIVGNLCLIIISLLMTVVFSGVIGFEREYHGHSAGFRTHQLVALGSAVIMIISLYGFAAWDAIYLNMESEGGVISRDPSRLAAQVISGVGFLGAGAIVQNGVSVRGLTTAATIWMSMAIGLTCGSGCFVIAAIATIIAFITLVMMRKIERFAARKNPMVFLIVPGDTVTARPLLETASRYGLTISETKSELFEYQGVPAVRIIVRIDAANTDNLPFFVDDLRNNMKPLEIMVTGAEK